MPQSPTIAAHILNCSPGERRKDLEEAFEAQKRERDAAEMEARAREEEARPPAFVRDARK